MLDREVVQQVLGRLRPRERQIIEMRFFDEMTQAQIAEQIGTSQVHVGRLIASSLTLLRAHLGEDPVIELRFDVERAVTTGGFIPTSEG